PASQRIRARAKADHPAEASRQEKEETPLRRADLPAVELRDRGHHALQFVIAQFGEDWQRQRISSGTFRYRQVSRLVSQIGKALLQVQRNRIVDLRADSALREKGAQLVAAIRTHHVLVID